MPSVRRGDDEVSDAEVLTASGQDPRADTAYDVVVIGGGPAGSTVAALLAQRGRKVALLEKSRHPRFHIGESLLPLNMPLFEQLGVANEIERIGMPKYGVEFVSPWHENSSMFEFAKAVDKSFPSAYHVRRSEFDEVLFRNAMRAGAAAFEECRATGVEFQGDGAVVNTRDKSGLEGRWQTRFVVDATGRDTLLANQFGIKRRNRRHNSAAMFAHFAGAKRLPGRAEGNISLFWFEHGWCWLIPLHDGIDSVGIVCSPSYMKTRKTDPEKFFCDTIALVPGLAERLRDAKRVSPVTATGNYSYSADRATGPNCLMLGDAFAFIDPMFSTGVYFAMHSAFTAADVVGTCLDRRREAPGALRAYEAMMRHGPKVFSWFIYRATSPTLRDLFMKPRMPEVQAGLLSVLAGDVYRDTPIRARVMMFKAVYYVSSLKHLKRTIVAWMRRRRAVRQALADSTGG
jgi:flavin-dependent dehydrogenase